MKSEPMAAYDLSAHKVWLTLDPDPEYILLQPVDDHDLEGLEHEIELIRSRTDARIAFAAFKVHDWNSDLSPWEAPPVYGDEPFGSGAADTLKFVLEEFLPFVREKCRARDDAKLVIGGYSLAALFALWAVYEEEAFDAASAASPSVWFPGWMDFARSGKPHADAVYLSLGTKEEKTRNEVMSRVGDIIREMEILIGGCADPAVSCKLEWNPGTHFTEPDVRTAKAFTWCVNALI